MNNISRRNFALLELSQCIKPSVGLLHCVVAVHCPSKVLRKMDTEELKCGDLFNIGPTNRDWARNATIVVKKVNSHAEYFKAHKLENMQNRMSRYVLKGLGLGDNPYQQNIPGSINDMLKDWSNFLPQDMDKFIVSLYDFLEFFDQEEDLTWFQLSDKWEVCPQFRQHLASKSHGKMVPEERKTFMHRVYKVCRDPGAYKRCRSFKFGTATCTTTSAESSSNQKSCDVSTLLVLMVSSPKRNRRVCLKKQRVFCTMANCWRVFNEGVSFVDSGGPLPYRVQCLTSGRCNCSCNFFSRDNLCFHSLAVAIHRGCVQKVVQAYKGRSLNKIATLTDR